MKAFREYSRCVEISGKRGAPWPEMRSSSRPTRYISLAPQQLRVLDSAEAPKFTACLFRETLRGIADNELLPRIDRTQVRVEAGNLAVWGSSKHWDAITQEEMSAEMTRAARQVELDFMRTSAMWSLLQRAGVRFGKAPLQGKQGDFEMLVFRTSYLAKEFANTKSDDFSPTLRWLHSGLCYAALGRSSSIRGRKNLAVDARRAHLHAFVE